MSLRRFAILCTLRFAGGSRPDAKENSIADDSKEGFLRSQCDEDKMPTKENTMFCAAFKSPEQCSANGCHQLDTSSDTAAFECRAPCRNVNSAAAMALPDMSDSPVPQEVKDAVQAARELVQAKATAAAAKVQQATQAEEIARKAKAALQEKEEVAAQKLRQAEALEAEARATKDKMEVAIADYKRADAELAAQHSAYETALAAKAEKKAVMMQKLQSKREQEAQWKLEDKGFAEEIADISKAVPVKEKLLLEMEKALLDLKQEVLNLKARRTELVGKRRENKNTRQTTGKAITQDYIASLNAYVKDRDRADALAAAEQNAKTGSEQAAGSARAAVADYWKKVADFSRASDAKTKAQEEAGNAQSANLEAQFALAARSEDMAEAAKERNEFDAFRIKVEGVREYAEVFYTKLGEVAAPNSNPMMNVMKLAQDAATKPCLSSYNVIITAANDLAQSDQTEILSKLKAGITKIDTDRYEHFKQWCGDENFVRWIWGANELTKAELAID